MKGIVFNLLAEAVAQKFGVDAWDDLLDAAGLEGAYTSLGSYDDAQLYALVDHASVALKQPPEAILRWFGRASMPMLAQRYPVFFDGHPDARSFLLTLNEIIHPEVRKLYPGAAPPLFDFDTSDPTALVMGYHSQRKLCMLAEGFIAGAADHYQETVEVAQIDCMHRGDAKCTFRLGFTRMKP